MKNQLKISLFAIVAFLGFAIKSNAQNTKCKKTSLGLQTGINNNNGILGISVERAIAKQFSLGAGVGIGSWGYKFFGEGRYYFNTNCYRGSAIGIALTHSTGFKDLAQTGLESNYGKVEVVLNGKAMNNASVSFYQFWNIGKRKVNRFYITAGYSIRFAEPFYDFANTTKNKYPNIRLNDVSDRAMKLIAPGGVILGLGFYFGL